MIAARVRKSGFEWKILATILVLVIFRSAEVGTAGDFFITAVNDANNKIWQNGFLEACCCRQRQKIYTAIYQNRLVRTLYGIIGDAVLRAGGNLCDACFTADV